MKRTLSLLAALLLCASMVLSVDASGIFVPSVTYKPTPPVQDAILDIPRDVLDQLPEAYLEDLLKKEEQEQAPEQENPEDPEATEENPEQAGHQEKLKTCVVVTSIQEAKEKTTDIYQKSRDILLELYEEISETSLVVLEEEETVPDATQETKAHEAMKLYFHDEEFVIREMVDVSLRREGCLDASAHYHQEALAIQGVTMSVDFDLGVGPDVEVVVLTYQDGKWTQVKKVTNNGDGTVTCVFEHFCPVIFCVPASSVEPEPTEAPSLPVITPVEPVQIPDYPLGALIALIGAFVLFLLLIFLRKKRRDEENETT